MLKFYSNIHKSCQWASTAWRRREKWYEKKRYAREPFDMPKQLKIWSFFIVSIGFLFTIELFRLVVWSCMFSHGPFRTVRLRFDWVIFWMDFTVVCINNELRSAITISRILSDINKMRHAAAVATKLRRTFGSLYYIALLLINISKYLMIGDKWNDAK